MKIKQQRLKKNAFPILTLAKTKNMINARGNKNTYGKHQHPLLFNEFSLTGYIFVNTVSA